jgi:O-antigen/teichoic acid export membrane protein
MLGGWGGGGKPNLNPVIYVVVANLIQAAFTLFILWNEFTSFKLKFDGRLWKSMMIYSMPLIIVGMGGMINETFDRLMLRWWVPGTTTFKEEQVGVYNACYKLSILITLFVQAFKWVPNLSFSSRRVQRIKNSHMPAL